MKIVTVAQMHQIEQVCGLPTNQLMENAGRAVAHEIRRIFGDLQQQRLLFLIGPGNNGGDGLVAARYLDEWGARVSLYVLTERTSRDKNFELVLDRGLTVVQATDDEELAQLNGMLASATIVVDAVFGTGKSRPLDGVFASVLKRVGEARQKRYQLRIVALDLPSGLDADSGAVDPTTPFADFTITLGFPKVGLFKFPGAERVGRLSVVDIGIPPDVANGVTVELITDDWARSVLPTRPLSANKGTFGRVLVVAGSMSYVGAAYLACSGAIRAGAGLVTLAMAESVQHIVASKLTEVTYLPLPEAFPGIVSPEAAELVQKVTDSYDVLLVGCGLGQSDEVQQFIASVLMQTKARTILDADALNTLAGVSDWWQQLPSDAILTPHPGEMARLTDLTVDEIQADRVAVVQKKAVEWHKTVVLKGAFSVIASPDGQARISPIANPGLATAGTGDVLAGAIAGLLAQGLTLFDAASLGVYLHGRAGDLVRDQLGDTGMVASDLLPALPLTIKRVKDG